MPKQQATPLALYSSTKRSKSGRKRNDQLPETSALKSGRKFRAKCAVRLSQGIKEGNAAQALCGMTFHQSIRSDIHTDFVNCQAILELEAEGDVLQTVPKLKSLLIPHLDKDLVCHGEFAQTDKLHRPTSHSIDLSGVDESHSSEDAASESCIPTIPSPSSTSYPNGGTSDEWMILHNPTEQLWCDFIQQLTTEPISLASLAAEVAEMTLF